MKNLNIFFIFLTALIVIIFLPLFNEKNIQRSKCLQGTQLKEITIKEYHLGKKYCEIKFDELKIQPKKYYIFTIYPLDEIFIDNVVISHFSYDEFPPKQLYCVKYNTYDENFNPTPKLNIGSQSQNGVNENVNDKEDFVKNDIINHVEKSILKNINIEKVITKVTMKNISLKLYENNDLYISIDATKAYIDFKSSDVIFIDAVINKNISREIIKTKHLILNNKSMFRIPGKYILISQSGLKYGRALGWNPLFLQVNRNQ